MKTTMRKAMSKWGGALVLGLFAVAAHAAPANSSGYLDSIANTFQTSAAGWMTTAQGYAFSIFTGLAGLDLAWWGIKNVLKKNDLSDFFAGMTLKISSVAFFYTIIKEAPTWMPLILQSFTKMGQGIGGAGAAAISPSQIMGQAFSVTNQLWAALQAQPGGLTHLASNMFLGLIVAATSILALIGFSLVALQLLMTLIESYLVGGAGLVMLGFTGSNLTSTFGEKYICYMVSVGIKLLTIYAIAGLGGALITSEIGYINGWMASSKSLPPMDLLSVGTSMLMYGAMGVMVPGMASSLMNGSPGMSLGNIAGGAAAVAGGVAGAGVAAVGGYAGAVGAAQGGLNKLASLTGAGAGGPPTGGVGGTDKLAALGAMTGAGSGSTGSIGGSKSSAGPMGGISSKGGTGDAPSGPPASSPVDFLQGGYFGGTGMPAGGSPDSGATSKGVSNAGRLDNAGSGSSQGSGQPKSASPSAQADGAKPISARFKEEGQSGSASAGTGPTAPSTGGADSLGAPQSQTGSGNTEPSEADKDGEGKNPWSVMKDGLGQAASSKDDIARHEGGGGGIQIRLGHSE